MVVKHRVAEYHFYVRGNIHATARPPDKIKSNLETILLQSGVDRIHCP